MTTDPTNRLRNEIQRSGTAGLLVFAALATCLSACVGPSVYISPIDRAMSAVSPPPDSERKFEALLVGDAGGAFALDSEPALRLLKNLTQSADSNSVVVFLGDNIYCCGMPDSSSAGRAQAEMRMDAQMEAVADYAGRVFFIPGNHDWGGSIERKSNQVNREEAYVEAHFGGRNVFLPDDGLPGPIDVKLQDGLRLILLDTEWWMESEKPFGESGSTDIEEDGDFFLELDDLLKRRRHDDLVIVGHHPVRSNGNHGGHFSLKDHVFPLTVLRKELYIPLPVVGSLYPIVRRLAGGPQDFSNPRYKTFRASMDAIFSEHDGRIIYASGHEHTLQYFSEGHIHHVVSGTGSSSTFAAPGNGARFTSDAEGLMRIRFYQDGEIWLEAIAADASNPEGRILYRTQMEAPLPETITEPVVVRNEDRTEIPPGATEKVTANPSLAAGALHALLLGSENRKAWTTEVEIPVFDIRREGSGLTPVARGGSMQTTSVRLQNEAGKQFVLRSVNKDPTRSVPPELRATLVADITIDQLSMMQPFGAVMAAPLAEAVGVYHSNPKFVVVPDDPLFGPYRDLVSGMLMLFEERPDQDMSNASTFGNSRDVIGTVSMFRKITADNDDRVDEKYFARARLLDMFLADWDRHADQWRWASFPAEDYDGTAYRAIPRDRDWAFQRVNGLFPSLAKLPFILPKLQGFGEKYGNLRGMNGNGMMLDRRFTSGLEREDWAEIARSMQTELTDKAIDDAVGALPDPIEAIYGEEYRATFRARRDGLVAAAENYYDVIAKLADVVGSDKHERFEVARLDDERTEVVVYKTSKEGEIRREMYRRTFLRHETKEIRLYGLGGNDTFVFEGKVRHGIPVRAVGGTGSDRFLDRSVTEDQSKSVLIYDVPFQTTVEPGHSTSLRISSDPLVNRYDQREYGYTDFIPALYPGTNQDDGLFLGGGGQFTLYGFRKSPYSARHAFRGNVATRTGAFNLQYAGRFIDRIFGWDVGLSASAKTPNNIRNYFGLGNESENTVANAEYYQARFSSFSGLLELLKPVGGFFEYFIGPTFEYTDIKRDTLRFVGQPQTGVSPTTYQDQTFLGLVSGVRVDSRDSAVFPRQGIFWENRVHARLGLRGSSSNFMQVGSEFAVYTTPTRLHSLTLAARIGGRYVFGDFPFFMASTLGGKDALRGWRSTRFSGRSSLFQSLEVRATVFRYSTLLAVGSAGILGFVDNGRVFTDGEHSRTWHQGYGMGFWFNLFDLSVFSGTVGFSEEETTFTLGIGLAY